MEPSTESRRPSPRRPDGASASRVPVVIALILSLIGCFMTQSWGVDWKLYHTGMQPQAAERGALGGMDTYALALMLGGLRGPLVMVLWSKVENQKIDRDLEDLDSMIEWIRLLQPEFDTVHIFQIWNKAYNISVMMASTASKYTTILDAVDYARRVERDRPGDLNICDSMTRVFAEKLGGKNVTERAFYRRQFREDTLTDENVGIAYPEAKGHYTRMGIRFVSDKNGPLLDEHNNILSELLTEQLPRPANVPPSGEWNDGAELQYLRKYQPFPYGISPIAMGYNYAKRAQVAMTVGGQKPLQISDTVIDSRPGLTLKQWAEEEADRGVTFEAQAFGLPHDADPHALETSTAAMAPGHPVPDSHALDAAAYSYQVASQVCDDSYREYKRHLTNPQYINPYNQYTSHLDELTALRSMSQADYRYLEAFRAGADRRQALADAAKGYRQALTRYELMVLKYSTEPSIADSLYRGQQVDLDKLDDNAVDALYQKVILAVAALQPRFHVFDDQRDDSGAYINRFQVRLGQLAGK